MSGPPQSRIYDFTSISCPHGNPTGMITSGSPNGFVDSRNQARLTDTVICLSCGASGNIVSGSMYTNCDGLKSARVTDICVGTCDPGCDECPHSRTGVIVTGSSYTNTL